MGQPALVYYGNPDGICVATSVDDGLRSWSRHPCNPLIPQPTDPQAGWRAWDPCAWRDGDRWYLVCGGKVEGAGDTAFLFRSRDFVHWEYGGLFYEPGGESDCAVPDVFRLGEAHVLLFASHERGVQYYVGEMDGERFAPQSARADELRRVFARERDALRRPHAARRRRPPNHVRLGHGGPHRGRPAGVGLVGRDVFAAGAHAGQRGHVANRARA